MELPNLSLRFLVLELQPFVADAFVSRIQAIGENQFKLKLSTKQGSKELILLPHFLYLTEFGIPPASEQANFVQLLRKHIQGKKIRSVRQHEWDRIVEIEFEKNLLVLELFASGNIVLTEKESGKTVACLHNEEWKDRVTKRNQPYRFPVSKPVPSDFSLQQFEEALKKSGKKIVSALVSEFNLFPGLAEEAVLLLGIAKETLATEIPAKKLKALHQSFSAFFSEQKAKPILAKTKNGSILLPFPLPHWLKAQKAETEPVSELNAALDSFLSPALSQPSIEKNAEQSKRLQKLLFSLEQQKKAVSTLEKQVFENRQKGEWIYANFLALEEIKKAIEKAEQKGYSKKQILEILQKSELKEFEIAKKVVDLDMRKKTIVLDFSA